MSEDDVNRLSNTVAPRGDPRGCGAVAGHRVAAGALASLSPGACFLLTQSSGMMLDDLTQRSSRR